MTRRIAEALAMPELRNQLNAMGGRAAPSSAEENTRALLAEMASTEQMMKASAAGATVRAA